MSRTASEPSFHTALLPLRVPALSEASSLLWPSLEDFAQASLVKPSLRYSTLWRWRRADNTLDK